MVAHSEEDGNNDAQQLVVVPRQKHQPNEVYVTYSGGKIPQPAETYAYIASKIFDKNYNPGDYIAGINEFQVTVANNMSWTRGVPEATAWDPPIPGGVIWTEFTQIALERAKTAREGIQIIGWLCEKYHLSCDPGTMFAVADPNEGWWIEIARDGQWIAERVPDDGAVVLANSYRIGVVDLNDTKNILHSPNLIQYALSKGWYDGKKPFSFAEVYGDPENQKSEYNNLRYRMLDPEVAKGKLSVEKLMQFMRWEYEGTPAFKADPKTGSPFRTETRNISRLTTVISSVAQLRSWMPASIGAVMWWNIGPSKTGVYVPWYLGTEEFPLPFTRGTNQYTEDSAYWTYAELAELADAHYKDVIEMINKTWHPFEVNELSFQPSVEEHALALFMQNPQKARQFLTWYSNALGERSYQMARRLIGQIKTKVYNE